MRILFILMGFFWICAFSPYAQAAGKSDRALINLIKAVNDGNMQDLRVYIDTVGDEKNILAVDTLVKLLKNKNPVIRWKTYVALSKIDTSSSKNAVASGIAQEDELFWKTFKEGIDGADKESLTQNILTVGKPLLPQLKKISLDPMVKDKIFIRELMQKIVAAETNP